jgi:Fic family protein
MLRRSLRVRTIQASLQIEGNTLTEEQVTAVLEGKRVAAPERDLREVRNAIACYEKLLRWHPGTAKHLLAAHKIMMTGLVKQPGAWRSQGVGIAKGNQIAHIAPPAARVPGLMESLLTWVRADADVPAPIRAAVCHYEMEFIHPFEDGNGRAGRLLMNLFLMRQGYPIAIILKSDRVKYYKALEKADKEDFEYLVRLIAQAVERSLNVYIQAIESTSNEGEFLPLSMIASKTTYSAKYLNLLINKGLLAGKKEGRNWLTSMKDIKDYEVTRLRIREPRKKIRKSKENLR